MFADRVACRKQFLFHGALILGLFVVTNCNTAAGEIPTDTLRADLSFGIAGMDVALELPDGLVVLPDGTVLISDEGNNRLVQFTSDGEFIRDYGSIGSGELEFHLPSDIALGTDRVFVTDQRNRRVVMLSFDLDWLGEIFVDMYPDVVAPHPDGSVLVGCRGMSPGPFLLARYSTDGRKLGVVGAPFGDEDDDLVTKTALNVVTVDFLDPEHLVICFKGLAYCKCGETEGGGWIIRRDIDETRDWFYGRYFPDRPLPSEAGNNSLENFINDIKDKCRIDNATSVPLFVDDVTHHDGRIVAVVSSSIHEYTYSGDLVRRSIVLDRDGERVVIRRIAFGQDGTAYTLAKYVDSSCWRVQNYQRRN